MDRLLARLERRIGRYAIPNLIWYVVVGMGIFGALLMVRPEALSRMVLDLNAVRRGQVWRLFTFLLIPPASSPLMLLINLYFTWWVGSSLEQRWGAFKFNVYYFIGAIVTVLAAVVTGPASNLWLDLSLFLAFATTFPDESILLFFILPIRVKWLGIIAGVWIAFSLATSTWSTQAAIAAALVNYCLFFTEHWFRLWRDRNVRVRQQAKRASMRPSAPTFGQRLCAICGAREADGTDIRVCSCEKCGGKPRDLCLEHARNH
jgi:membrane associated rhomboid family serine protease